MAAIPSQFEFWVELVKILNKDGYDLAIFFPRYTLTPYGVYPTQLRQVVGALRYILTETGRSPANVIVGGDSAGGNLALATLLHLSHPHPDIDPIELSEPLAGVFAFAPWIDFSQDWPSFKDNEYKDVLTGARLTGWSDMYLDGKPGDSWSEPARAPVDWWKDAKTQRILILVGEAEMLLSPIEAFTKKLQVCWRSR